METVKSRMSAAGVVDIFTTSLYRKGDKIELGGQEKLMKSRVRRVRRLSIELALEGNW